MSGELKVTVAGLRALSQSCAEQAGQLVASPTATVAAAPWQTSGTTANTLSGRGTKVTATMNGRLTANATKFSQAANGYEAADSHSAEKLARSEFAGAGADGGAGGLPTPPPIPSTVPVGADGGAGAFPVSR